MKRSFLFATFALLTVAACSHSDQAGETQSETANRDTLKYEVVQSNRKADAETAAKVSRDDKLKQLKILLGKLAKTTDLPAAFKITEDIEDLGIEIAPELQAGVKALTTLPRIAGLRAVWTLGSLANRGWDVGNKGLLEIVVGDEAQSLRIAAAQVLGSTASQRHAKALRKALHEQVFEPSVKIQLAIALWRTAKDTSATKILREMLKSDNESFRIRAALALGEINQLTSDSKPILELLAEEPTVRGRIAARALRYERELKRLEAAVMNRLPGQPKVERIDTRLLETIEGMIKERYIYPDAVSGRKLIYAAAAGMFEGLDPYTCVLEGNQLRDAAELRKFAVPTLGLALGSVRINKRTRIRLTVVLSVVEHGPAHKAGLRPGDRIFRVLKNVNRKRVHALRIDSSGLPDVKTRFQSLPIDEAVSRLQAPVGAGMGIRFLREGWLLSRWAYLTHKTPVRQPIEYEILPGGIGMIHLHEISSSAPVKVKEALAAFSKAKIKSVILDLRNASGGSADAATLIAGLFLKKGTLVTYSSGRSKKLAPTKSYSTAEDKPDLKIPLTVLINRGTADGGEILAGALREHKRARTVGTRSFGRASIQELIQLDARELRKDRLKAGLLLTVARFYGPVSRMAWFDRGVSVDVELKPHEFEGWIYDELEVIGDKGLVGDFVHDLFGKMETKTLEKLARGDQRKTAAYKGFDAWFETLGVHMGHEEVRWAVRRELRRQVRDRDPSASLNKIDLQEDREFTGALKEAARAAGIDLGSIPEYAVIEK